MDGRAMGCATEGAIGARRRAKRAGAPRGFGRAGKTPRGSVQIKGESAATDGRAAPSEPRKARGGPPKQETAARARKRAWKKGLGREAKGLKVLVDGPSYRPGAARANNAPLGASARFRNEERRR